MDCSTEKLSGFKLDVILINRTYINIFTYKLSLGRKRIALSTTEVVQSNFVKLLRCC